MVLSLMLTGLAVALDPLPLTAFLVVLPSERGVRKGAAFVFGWLVCLAIVVTVTVLATGNNPPKPATAPSLAALAVKIVLGVVLVRIAVRHIRARGRPKPPKQPPKWQAQVDSMSPWFALALAPTLQPWVLIGAGAATVVEAKLSSWESFLALFLYCVLASSSYLAIEIYAIVRPAQSQALLARFRTWIDSQTDQVIIVGSLIVGFWLIADSLSLIVLQPVMCPAGQAAKENLVKTATTQLAAGVALLGALAAPGAGIRRQRRSLPRKGSTATWGPTP